MASSCYHMTSKCKGTYDKTSSKKKPVFNDKKIIVCLGGHDIHPHVKTSGFWFPFQQIVNRWSVAKDQKKQSKHLLLLFLRYGMYVQTYMDWDWIESSPAERQGILEDEKLDMSQQCVLRAQKAGLHKKQRSQQVQGGDSPPPLPRSDDTPPGVLCPVLESSTQKRHGLVGGAQRRATKIIRGMECLCYE